MAHDGAVDFLQQFQTFHAHKTTRRRLPLADKPGTSALSGWFLGPLGENRELFRELVGLALDANCDAREAYAAQFGDPPYVTPARKELDGHTKTTEALREHLNEVLHDLKGSIPLSSYRNQSHMYWDITLPAMVGYFAAMLYNQNNVAAEASPVTTLLEIEVGRDLCAMLGYDTPTDAEIHAGAIAPWGHNTCDGSVANGESMWAARNLKLLPIALVAAIKGMPEMAAGRMLTVPCPTGGRAHLVDLDTWSLLNLRVDDVIALSPRLQSECGLDAATIEAALNACSVQTLGLAEFQRRFLTADAPHLPVVITPATAHYSWPRSAALPGLGFTHLWKVPVDLDGRMSTVALRRMLDQCLRARRPVMQVVAVIGTTEESAVDPLTDIVAIREEYRQMGLEFVLHVDCAWGGYFNAIVPRENDDLVANLADDPAALQVFRDMGSDQNVMTYAVNFRTADGWNTDLGLMNELTNAIYRHLSISDFNGGKVPDKPMFVTASSFEVADYGQDFVDAFAARAGVVPTPGTRIQFLVSTTLDPWVTATATGNYLPYIVAAFKTKALECAGTLVREHGLAPFDRAA